MNRLTFEFYKGKFLIKNWKDILGVLYFHLGWKKFVSEFYRGFIFDSSCLREIADECDKLTKEKFS